MKNKAIFLDRDGTLIKEKNYLKEISELELESDTIQSLQLLQNQGFLLIIITNQSGIGQSILTVNQFLTTQNHLIQLLAKKGIKITDFYYCPHHPKKAKGEFKKECDCRKPKPGMILKAISEHNIDPTHSYMIGDKWDDVSAGKNANLKSILVKTGYGKESSKNPLSSITPDYIAENLLDATQFILKTEKLS